MFISEAINELQIFKSHQYHLSLTCAANHSDQVLKIPGTMLFVNTNHSDQINLIRMIKLLFFRHDPKKN